MKERPTVRVKVEYEILANGKLLATGHTMHVFVNMLGQPVRPPKDVLDTLLEAFDKQ